MVNIVYCYSRIKRDNKYNTFTQIYLYFHSYFFSMSAIIEIIVIPSIITNSKGMNPLNPSIIAEHIDFLLLPVSLNAR